MPTPDFSMDVQRLASTKHPKIIKRRKIIVLVAPNPVNVSLPDTIFPIAGILVNKPKTTNPKVHMDTDAKINCVYFIQKAFFIWKFY
ncbi:MAG: hypothetical protein FGM61_08550 [Sediminibacterium sp.]|nr:hypothetical protein [Sediminibacterium sp.]